MIITYFGYRVLKNQNLKYETKKIGRKISIAIRMREDSDYEDEFVVEPDDTKAQIETAKELLDLVENYIEEK